MEKNKSGFKQWACSLLEVPIDAITPLKGDASARSFYRVTCKDTSVIGIDDPSPSHLATFVEVAKDWDAFGLKVPAVLSWEKDCGYALVSDFGDTQLLDKLQGSQGEHYYSKAMEVIHQIHAVPLEKLSLPFYDAAFIRKELMVFQEWFLERLIGSQHTKDADQFLGTVSQLLVANALEQPACLVHRDFHSRNIMVLPDDQIGIIDFQDAMIGPVTYDLASLLKDCYISWPTEKVTHWVKQFHHRYTQRSQENVEFATFLRWFDWMGLKRHLRVLGTFSRLKLAYQKEQYLNDIPRIMTYILEVTGRYSEFEDFHLWLRSVILPPLQSVLHQENITVDSHQVA